MPTTRDTSAASPAIVMIGTGVDVPADASARSGVASKRAAVHIYRQLVEAWPDAFMPTLATSVNYLSMVRWALDKREDALVAIDDAVELRRNLAEDVTEAFRPALATSLNNRATDLAGLASTVFSAGL